MTRRGYLKSVAAALAALFARNAGAHIVGPAYRCSVEDGSLTQKIEQLFSDTDSARVVGLRYLAESPGSAYGALDRVRELADASYRHGAKASFEEQLVRQRRDDFASCKSVIIDGWVMARCEADLCAALVCLARGWSTNAL